MMFTKKVKGKCWQPLPFLTNLKLFDGICHKARVYNFRVPNKHYLSDNLYFFDLYPLKME